MFQNLESLLKLMEQRILFKTEEGFIWVEQWSDKVSFLLFNVFIYFFTPQNEVFEAD